MKKKFLLASLTFCLLLFGSTGPSPAQADREVPSLDALDEMIQKGWKPVAEGVLQRERGDRIVETFAFGTEGFNWVAKDLQARLERMQEEYRQYPSKKLARAIEKHKAEIARVKGVEKSGELSSSVDSVIINGCDISYGVSGNAYSRSDGGAEAWARAYFHNNCGYWGDTYAYAYARATEGTTTTTVTQTDPRSGTWVDSYAFASARGTTNCYSEAYGSVYSSALGVYYSWSPPYNTQCANPLSVTITGVTSTIILGYNCKTVTWSASVSGGASPFSYSWTINGGWAGSGSSVSRTFCGSNWTYSEVVNVGVTVTDRVGQTASDTHSTTINYYYRCDDPCFCASPDGLLPIEPCYATPE